ncbi:MAG: FtsX-like permease family protein [Flavobacteriaceae bacterium]|nr:FtsX-like permease family protein [Flavobacteriaceae bacterium]
MNYELFIAKRIIAIKQDKSSVSSPIIKIAIIAIALGLIVMIITVATGLGLQHKIRDKVSGLNGHILISNFNQNNGLNTTNPITTDQYFYPKFKNIEGIKNVQVFAKKNCIIRTEIDFEAIIFKGVSLDYDWSFIKDNIVEGNVLSLAEKQSNKILISKITAERLQFKLGDKVVLWFLKEGENNKPIARALFIEGIFNTGFKEFDKNYVFGDIRHIQKINKWTNKQVGGFEILITHFKDLKLISNQIYKEIDPNLNATPINKKFASIFEWIALFDINISLIIIIMIIIAGINMITALLVLILERTQMIGILKALGNTNKSIQKIFLYNASYLILKGLFWGNLIGLSFILIEKHFGIIKLDPENYYVSNVPYYINFYYILALNIGTLLLCLLMLILPTYLVSKINPVKAIKFD